MRKKALETLLACSPDGKSVIPHVGAVRMEDAIELTRHASAKRAQAISGLPPAGAFSFEEIREYYWISAEVSDVCPWRSTIFRRSRPACDRSR